MKSLLNVLKLLIILLIVVCYISFAFMICRFYPNFSGKEWIHLITALLLMIYLCDYIFKISFKEKIKRNIKKVILVICFVLLLVVCTLLYFNSEKIHGVFIKDTDECVATVWYYANNEYGNIYKFNINNDRKVSYEFSELQFEPISFSVDIMDIARAEEPPLLNRQPEGYRFITKYKYNKLIENISQLKEENIITDGSDMRKKSKTKFKAYISYDGEVFDISDIANTTLKNNTILYLFKCINFNSPNNLIGWYELKEFEMAQNKMAFFEIIKYSIGMGVITIAIFSILKAIEKIRQGGHKK